MGLRGSGSYDYEIPERFVETGATWNINMGYAAHQSGGTAFALGPQAYGSIGTSAWALWRAEEPRARCLVVRRVPDR